MGNRYQLAPLRHHTNMAALNILLCSVYVWSCLSFARTEGKDVGRRYLLDRRYHWGQWSGYTTCDDCISGSKSRQRSCFDSNNQHMHTSFCKDNAVESTPCQARDCSDNDCVDTYNVQPTCPVSYCTEYRNWSKTYCKKTCGYCPPVDGRYHWGPWSGYTMCNGCISSSKSRQRSCYYGNNQKVHNSFCKDNAVEFTPCQPSDCSNSNTDCVDSYNAQPTCPVSYCTNYREWSKTYCKKTCGYCPPVNGAWSRWTDWSTCTKSCGEGKQTRARMCDSPAPKFGGIQCNGEHNETVVCKSMDCPDWLPFRNITACSVTCGTGFIQMKRYCSSGNQSECTGGEYTEKPCQLEKCL